MALRCSCSLSQVGEVEGLRSNWCSFCSVIFVKTQTSEYGEKCGRVTLLDVSSVPVCYEASPDFQTLT